MAQAAASFSNMNGAQEFALPSAIARDLILALSVRYIQVANPTAGTDPVVTVPAGQLWELRSFSGLLTTSAAATTRKPQFQLADQDGNVILLFSPSQACAVNTPTQVNYATGVVGSTVTAPSTTTLPSPPLIVRPGFQVAFKTNALDVADQWTKLFVCVREISAMRALFDLELLSNDLANVIG